MHTHSLTHTPQTYAIAFPRLSCKCFLTAFKLRNTMKGYCFAFMKVTREKGPLLLGSYPLSTKQGSSSSVFWLLALCYNLMKGKVTSQMIYGVLWATQKSGHGAQVLNGCRKVISEEGTFTYLFLCFPIAISTALHSEGAVQKMLFTGSFCVFSIVNIIR